uniref:Uncharacterized protein LOC107407403 n=1 Tax=Rhizophora mucronata TaxID=61149 RepID=A0A2P2Q6E0_RHIMU
MFTSLYFRLLINWLLLELKLKSFNYEYCFSVSKSQSSLVCTQSICEICWGAESRNAPFWFKFCNPAVLCDDD